MIIDRIRREIPPGTVIPKPEAAGEYIVKSWGRRRGEDALIYFIPNRSHPEKPYEKGITTSEFRQAFQEIQETGKISRQWFNHRMQACAFEGSCNFTTIGGIFELLGIAVHERARYVRV